MNKSFWNKKILTHNPHKLLASELKLYHLALDVNEPS